MKKIFYLAAAAGLVFGSCVKNDTDAAVDAVMRTLKLETGIAVAGDGQSRAVYSDDAAFAWEENDYTNLGIFIDNSRSAEATALTIDPANAGRGTFTISYPEGAKGGYAYYPKKRTAADIVLYVNVAEKQTTGYGTLPLTNATLVSREAIDFESEETTVRVAMQAVTPVVKFLVYDTEASHDDEYITSVSVKTVGENTAHHVWGTVWYKFSSGECYNLRASGDTVTAEVENAAIADGKDNSKGIYVVLLPAEASSVVYTVNTDKGSYTFDSSKTSNPAQTFTQNTIYTLSLNLSRGEFEALSSEPFIESVSAADADGTVFDGDGGGRFYLNRYVKIEGSNLQTVTAAMIGDVTVSSTAFTTHNANCILFKVPEEGIEFATTKKNNVLYETATDVEVSIVAEDKTVTADSKVKVYPFYFYSDVKIGVGSSSTNDNPYPQFAWENAFFLPDTGEIISTDEWWNSSIDGFVKNEESAIKDKVIMGNDNKETTIFFIDKEKVDANAYYGVQPYLFITLSSKSAGNKLAWQNPANSASQLKCHRYGNGTTSLPGLRGTPIIYFKILKSGDTGYDDIKNATIETLGTYTSVGGTSAPVYSSADNSWQEGSVLVVQYANYSSGINDETGAKPANYTGFRKQGFMYIKEVTCGDLEDTSIRDLNGYIKFDFYWSKVLNE